MIGWARSHILVGSLWGSPLNKQERKRNGQGEERGREKREAGRGERQGEERGRERREAGRGERQGEERARGRRGTTGPSHC